MHHISFTFVPALALCAVLTVGCNKSHQPAHESGHGDHAGKEAKTDHAKHAAHAAGEEANDFGLKRNGESLWKMDAHTRNAMGKLGELVRAGTGSGAAADHHALAAKMQTELQSLVRGCTMQGPDHDMLHVYLGALFPRVAALAKADDPKVLATTLAEINALMAAWPRFFE